MDVAAKLELLRHIPYFRSLPQTALQRLATSLRERCYQPGDVIFRKGDQSEGLGVVLRGRVRTVTTSPEGREQVLKVFGPERTFGDIPVFDDEPQPADAMAMSESIVVFIPQGDLLDCLREHPEALSEELPSASPEYTQDQLAAMVGSVREVVQRALKTLEHTGLIQMARGRIQIIDLEALEGWSASESMNA